MPWLFSRKLDLLVFWGSLVAAHLICLALGAPKDIGQGLITFIIVFSFLDVGHIFLTYFPITSKKEFILKRPALFFVPLFVLVGLLTFYAYSAKTFTVFFGTLGFYHILSQQYGWLTLYQKRSQQKRFLKFERLLFWWVLLLPVFYFFNGYSHLRVEFFVPHDLPRIQWFSRETYIGLMGIGLALSVYFQVWQFSSGKLISLPKTIFWWANVIWFYYGLMVPSSDPRFFRTSLMLVHALSYFFYIRNFNVQLNLKNAGWKNILALASIGLFWGYTSKELLLKSSQYFFFGPALACFPLLTHYVYDSFIWRRWFSKGTGTSKQEVPLRSVS